MLFNFSSTWDYLISFIKCVRWLPDGTVALPCVFVCLFGPYSGLLSRESMRDLFIKPCLRITTFVWSKSPKLTSSTIRPPWNSSCTENFSSATTFSLKSSFRTFRFPLSVSNPKRAQAKISRSSSERWMSATKTSSLSNRIWMTYLRKVSSPSTWKTLRDRSLYTCFNERKKINE